VFDASVIPLSEILRWTLVMMAVGFGMMGFDKGLSSLGNERISEGEMILIAFAGGFLGIILGGQLFQHKTSKPGFTVVAIFAGMVWFV
jgi:uncharacterized membrane protein YsdA (DUF1294 family)